MQPHPFAALASATLSVALLGVILAMPAAASRAGDFPPDTFQNLKVLPADIGTRELIDTMKAISRSLGVRCPHCHVGEEGQDLATFDFVSDAKPSKQAARGMLRMTRDINQEHLAKMMNLLKELEPDMAHAPEVTCATCHRGRLHPDSSIPDPGGGR